MPGFISLSNLTWSFPDGTTLFPALSVTFGFERTGIVGRNGSGKTTLMRLISGELRPASGSVRVCGTLGLLKQDVREDPDETLADLFHRHAAILGPDGTRTGEPRTREQGEPDDPVLFSRMEGALRRCGLAADPRALVTSLSGGQRTRAALAALLLARPDFLLLDEPTNNLDQAGRRAVLDLMRQWKAGALVISHDRALLAEMDAIVELTARGATRCSGPYDEFLRHKETERNAAHQALAQARKACSESARRARQATERKARKDSQGRKSRAKGGQSKILLDAARERAEASSGAHARLRDARRDSAESALAVARQKIDILQPLRMEIPSTGLPAGATVLRLEGVSGGHDAGHPVIRDLSFSLTGPERLAIAGPNGSGKTTLIRLISGRILPTRGTVDLKVPFAVLDQHLGLLDPGLSLLDSFLGLHPQADHHTAHAVLARFMFRAGDALRRVGTLSGGERVRAGLACVLGAVPLPRLLILDEPTNHLDLDGVEALETALAAYDGAMVIASHDEAFLHRLAVPRLLTLPG
ncbi:ABC-F family ATP-binding cassette domain-containing protein [Pararhodospirillum oryzae]|uniref:ABC transporter n=1 Tax=Pararhodospirillum oryzae TaxID=478448 RepID=A0A512HC13_9PROT|nr:ABC-F family ATP-binding cassette domain-containing protein [Pararhodospirillum oryzae]GEO82995.1 ABC transporter [Pararhodospirillum oryzae]